MATLNGEKVCINDMVYDVVYGPGKVVDASQHSIIVKFGGAGRPRKYSFGGVTGKNCYKTLYHRPPIVLELPRDECNAAKLTAAAHDMMKIMNSLTQMDVCCAPKPCDEPCEPCGCTKPCGCW